MPAAWLGWLCHAATGTCRGTNFPPGLGNAGRNVFSPKKWLCSELCCWIGKHHVEEKRGNLGGIRKLDDEEPLVLDKADGSSPSPSVWQLILNAPL